MTYNVFSGTLNPTHFTSLHSRMQNASDKLTSSGEDEINLCIGNLIYEGTERQARHETTAITTTGRTDDNAAAGTNGTR